MGRIDATCHFVLSQAILHVLIGVSNNVERSYEHPKPFSKARPDESIFRVLSLGLSIGQRQT
jgi:hypothetical protein